MKLKEAKEKLGVNVRKVSENTRVVERRGHAHPITPTEEDMWSLIEELCDDD